MDNSIYSNLHDSIDSSTTITIKSNDSENYNITPSRSSLRNLSYESDCNSTKSFKKLFDKFSDSSSGKCCINNLA